MIKLALRNVLRQKKRSALSTISIICGVAVIIFSRGFVGGIKENIVRAQVDSMSGHVMARQVDYPTAGINHPVDVVVELDEATEQWLDDETVAWTERVIFSPRVVIGQDSMRARGIGFDPDRDEDVFPRTTWEVLGEIPNGPDDGVLVGSSLARLLSLDVGDDVVLETRTHAGALNAMSVPVSGIVRTANPAIDMVGMFLHWDLAQDLVRADDKGTHLALRLRDRDDAPAVAAALSEKLGPEIETIGWEEETRPLTEIQDLRQKIFDFFAFSLFAMAATGIANTVLMAAYERIREIGTMRALGMTRGAVVRLFVAEGFVMGIIGAVVGAALAAWGTWHYSVNGIDMTSMIDQAAQQGTYNNIPFTLILFMEFNELYIVVGALFGVAVAVLASIYPAFVASKLPPAEAVKAN